MALKGKTTFELTNVETGEVAVTEDSNMLTNGLKYLLTSYPFEEVPAATKLFKNRTDSYDSVSTGIKRVMNMLTGGIILFDTALEENADNIFPPAGAESVACGAPTAYSGINTCAGSYNDVESGPVKNDEGNIIGYKHVWDFSTSQGNGHIACACLTTREGGHIGAGVAYALRDEAFIAHSYGDNEAAINTEDRIGVREVINAKDRDGNTIEAVPFVYADYNRNLIFCPISRYTFGYGYINPSYDTDDEYLNSVIMKRKLELDMREMPFSDISIFNYCDTIGFKTIGTITVDMPVTLKNVLDNWQAEKSKSALVRYGCSSDEGFVYIWIYGNEAKTNLSDDLINPNDIIHVWKINMEDFTSTHLQIPNTTGHKLLCRNATAHVSDFVYVTNNYMLVRSWETTEIDGKTNYFSSPYMIELNNPANVIEVLNPDGSKPKSPYVTSSSSYTNHRHLNAYTIKNKVYYVQGSTTCFVIDLTTGKRYYRHTLSTCEAGNSTLSHAHAVYVQNSPGLILNLIVYSGNSSTIRSCGIRRHPELLLTINNLDTPVTKTTAQTMKVTYTLLEEGEEE